MSARGLHLALDDDELRALLALADEAKFDHINEELEESKFHTPDACETDKSWAYIHSAFNGTDPDGPLTRPTPNRPSVSIIRRLLGRQPDVPAQREGAERLAIAGSQALLLTDDFYIGLVPSDEVGSVADALEGIPTGELERRVGQMHRRFKASGSPDDAAEYAGGWYPNLVAFFRSAADSGKHVIFTVDF